MDVLQTRPCHNALPASVVRISHTPPKPITCAPHTDSFSPSLAVPVSPSSQGTHEVLRDPLPRRALVLECSGGSGHKRAAALVAESLQSHGIPYDKYDVLNSDCTFVPSVGQWCANFWDGAQTRGSVSTLDSLVAYCQMPMLIMCYFPTYFYIRKLLNTPDAAGLLPDRIIATSPMFLPGIAAAVQNVNKQSGRHVEIDLYMTELPTDQTHHYYRPLRQLTDKQAANLTLHAMPPHSAELQRKYGGNEAAYWRDKTGHALQVRHTYIVGRAYTAADLPAPNQQVSICLRAQSDVEKAFAKRHFAYEADTDTYQLDIKPDDHVELIMLGGVPTRESVLGYARQAIADAPLLANHHFLFLACGAASGDIYKSVTELIESHKIPENLTIVPFTTQEAARIMARADSTVTRSGGLTSIEIMWLKSAGRTTKKIFIHSEHARDKEASSLSTHRLLAQMLRSTGGLPPKSVEEGQAALRQAYEEYLCQGIPHWEAGNARYLRQEYNARCITPTELGMAFGLPNADPVQAITYSATLLNKQMQRSTWHLTAPKTRAA